jgi:heat shock protein HslJ
MACAPAVMELESAFVSAIQSIAFYAIVNDVLELRDAEHHLRLRFQARKEGP